MVTTLDFETQGIQPWPDYPPKPVGLAVRHADGRSEYLAWGHPSGNNSSREQAEALLRLVWNDEILFHNAAFDIEVARKEFGLPFPPRYHDTMFLMFLYDPHADTLALKPVSERLLGMPPDEQNSLEKWIRGHVKNTKEWGAHIADAPANIVGPYAIGDVERTFRLFEFLLPVITESGMGPAYVRELKLLPILCEATRRGIRVNVDLLAEHVEMYEECLVYTDRWLRDRLQSPHLNVDSNNDLADALDKAGLASGWATTPTGKRSTSKASLKAAVRCADTLAMLAYRNSAQTCLTTFMRPWLEQAKVSERCHPSWNQVRGADYGTRTGRLSSSKPNFQNVPNEFAVGTPEGLIELPRMRDYLLPEVGHVWVKRDYSQQELRVLAHFEDGALLKAYQANPHMDVHNYAAELIKKYTGHTFDRKQTKIVSFTLVYGGGIPALSDKLESTSAEAAILKESYLSSMPDVRGLMEDVKKRGRAKQSVKTTGGRVIYSERPKDGKDQSYKLLNHLIQGSSADITKQSIINWHSRRDSADMFLATVHDENNISAPKGEELRALRDLGEAMLDVPLDVPLLSEGFVGTSWGTVEAVTEHGAPYA